MDRARYFWPHMRLDMLNMLSTCATCAIRSPSQQMEPPVIDAEHIALLHPMQETEIYFAQYTNKHFLIKVDRASSCAFSEEAKGQTMVETVRILRRWFDEFGYPNIVRADDGPSFRTGLDCWLEENNVTRQKSAAYNSQRNGLAERGVKYARRGYKNAWMRGRIGRPASPR